MGIQTTTLPCHPTFPYFRWKITPSRHFSSRKCLRGSGMGRNLKFDLPRRYLPEFGIRRWRWQPARTNNRALLRESNRCRGCYGDAVKNAGMFHIGSWKHRAIHTLATTLAENIVLAGQSAPRATARWTLVPELPIIIALPLQVCRCIVIQHCDTVGISTTVCIRLRVRPSCLRNVRISVLYLPHCSLHF